MGADGGYHYVHRADLQRGLTEKDIDLFLKFTAHSLFRDTWKEDNDPSEEEASMKGRPGIDWFRYPTGTDFYPISGIEWMLDKAESFTNPPSEVWYYREFVAENKGYGHHYWWCEPVAWYVWGHSDVKDEQGWFKPLVTLPTPEELDELLRIAEWINAHHPGFYFETWT